MKKLLTVSVFAIMAVSAANADIASTTYVETRTGDVVLSGTNYVSGQTELTGAVRALDTQIKANAGDVVTLKGKADSAAAAISDLQTVDQTLQAEIAKKQVKLKVAADSAIKLAEDGTMTLEGIATSTELGNIQSAITKLDGAENVEGSVKKQIADAIAGEVLRSDAYADKAELDAIAAAKDYTDGLAGNYATAEQGAKADTAVQSVVAGEANGTIRVDGADVAVTGLGSAAYVETSAFDAAGSAATAKSEAIAAAEAKVKALENGQVKTNTGAIVDVKATADAAVQRDQVAMPVDFTVSEACKANGVICSLTIKGNGTGAVAQWEVVK